MVAGESCLIVTCFWLVIQLPAFEPQSCLLGAALPPSLPSCPGSILHMTALRLSFTGFEGKWLLLVSHQCWAAYAVWRRMKIRAVAPGRVYVCIDCLLLYWCFLGTFSSSVLLEMPGLRLSWARTGHEEVESRASRCSVGSVLWVSHCGQRTISLKWQAVIFSLLSIFWNNFCQTVEILLQISFGNTVHVCHRQMGLTQDVSKKECITSWTC